VRAADKVILVTDWSKEAFQNRYPKELEDKFVLIPNGCDLEDFASVRSVSTGSQNSKFTILHSGSLSDTKDWRRSPDTLFQAVSNILQEQPEVAQHLEVAFAGDFSPGHRRSAEDLGISKVVKELGHLPHDEVLLTTKQADLLLAINYEGFSTLIPGKIYEYWAVGGPPILLLSCPGAAADFIEKHVLGITVEPTDVSGIQKAILEVYRQSKTAMPLRVSTAGVEDYDRQALTKKLAQLLTMICQ
jgi:glycosyltransferase involved in cell wall biosynthesis